MSVLGLLPRPLAGPISVGVELDGKIRRIELSASGTEGEWTAVLDGARIEIAARLVQPGMLSLIAGGRTYSCVLEEGPMESAIHLAGRRYLFVLDDPRSLSARRRQASAAGGAQVIKAPMPGRIVRLLVEVGASVAAHQAVVVIEAMKMQNELKAARPGKVIEVRTKAGATVAAGEALLLIE